MFLGKFLICFSSKGGLGRNNLNFSTNFGHQRTFLVGKLKIIGRHRGVNVDLKVDFAKRKIIKNWAFSAPTLATRVFFWGNFLFFFFSKRWVRSKKFEF